MARRTRPTASAEPRRPAPALNWWVKRTPDEHSFAAERNPEPGSASRPRAVGMNFSKGGTRKASRKKNSGNTTPRLTRSRRVLPAEPRESDRGYVLAKEKKYFGSTREEDGMGSGGVLNTLVDDSDPDTDLTQIEHLLQTSEAIRADGHPRWMVLTGFLHDLGKCLCLYDEPQWAWWETRSRWAARGRGYCFSGYFARNPDRNVSGVSDESSAFTNELRPGKRTHVVWHDGYIAEVMKPYLRDEALYMLRFHRLSWHRHGATITCAMTRTVDAGVGAEVQSVRPLLQSAREAEDERTEALL